MTTNMLTESDTCIRDDVWLKIKSDPKISSDSDIAIAAKDGLVTLTGFVSSFWEKDAANEATMQVDGVKGIANDIQVRPFWQQSDSQIARNALRELENHVCIPDHIIKLTVKDGWITLEGNVDGEYERNLAASAVKRLKGVIGITNKIQVRPKVIPREVKG